MLAVLTEVPGDDAGGFESSTESPLEERQDWENETTAAQEAIRATRAEVHGATSPPGSRSATPAR